MAAAPTSATPPASQTDFRNSASKLTLSAMKVPLAWKAGQSAASTQQNTVARCSHGLGRNVAIELTTTEPMPDSASQPNQYMGGPSPLRGRCIQKSSLPTAG